MCIDFRDWNEATPKYEYPMLVADMLVNLTTNNEILSSLDGYSRYNQIYIAENDVSETAFRCLRVFGIYE